MDLAVVIVAAGRGLRASRGGDMAKQYVPIAGRTVLARTLDVFCRHPRVQAIQVVIHGDDRAAWAATFDEMPDAQRGLILPAVTGGTTRQASVLAGLEALEPLGPQRVLIHDAARPFVDAALIDQVVSALDHHEGAIPRTCRGGHAETG
ncbi:MAG: 2-C-methyl-D-erythritol 4-phosphate cytidylyltransferase [Hyphomicrobiaceae bacterium]